MNPLLILHQAIVCLQRNTLRSLLTMLAVAIGVGPFIIVVSLGQGLYAAIAAELDKFGLQTILVAPTRESSTDASQVGSVLVKAPRVKLTVDDAAAIRRDCPAVALLDEVVPTGARLVHDNRDWFTEVHGVGGDHLKIGPEALATGRFFSAAEARDGAKVCVLGLTVVNGLFPRKAPLGQILRADPGDGGPQVPLEVIGVLAPEGLSMVGKDQDDKILVPFSTVQKQITGRRSISFFRMKAHSEEEVELAQSQVMSTLRLRYELRDRRIRGFRVETLVEIKQKIARFLMAATAFFGCIVAISLLVGGIGIMNIMLVSVRERTHEIGIRMAVGARAQDVLIQFLTESVVLTTVGGACGIVFGVAFVYTLTSVGSYYSQANLPTLVSGWAIVVSFVFSELVGVFFGLYPAYQASQLDPIEALRFE